MAERKKIMILVGAERLGHGDDALGGALLGNFLKTLPEMGDELWRLVFVNAGVRLVAGESPALPALRELAASGVQILACSTCLAHFNLLDSQQVGEPTNMVDIVTAMQIADSVITL